MTAKETNIVQLATDYLSHAFVLHLTKCGNAQQVMKQMPGYDQIVKDLGQTAISTIWEVLETRSGVDSIHVTAEIRRPTPRTWINVKVMPLVKGVDYDDETTLRTLFEIVDLSNIVDMNFQLEAELDLLTHNISACNTVEYDDSYIEIPNEIDCISDTLAEATKLNKWLANEVEYFQANADDGKVILSDRLDDIEKIAFAVIGDYKASLTGDDAYRINEFVVNMAEGNYWHYPVDGENFGDKYT